MPRHPCRLRSDGILIRNVLVGRGLGYTVFMWFTRLAIARPLLIWMALAAVAILGLRAYSRLPAELNPQADIPTLVITTVYPGANPPEIEAQVTKRLEDAVGTVPGVREVTSSSQANVSVISVEFQVGSNLDTAMADARTRLDAIRADLPAEARPPVIAKLDINARPILEIGFTSASLTPQKLRAAISDAVLPRVQRVPGVANAQIVGGAQREIQVSADAAKLARYGLTVTDIVNSLKAAGRDVPGGGVARNGRETQVRIAGAFQSLQAIRDTQILAPQLQQSAAQSAQQAQNSDILPAPPLVVADVADVADAEATPTEISRVNGRAGVTLVVSRASDSNTVAVVEETRRALAELAPNLPADLKQSTLHDDAKTVRAALDDVDASLILGAVLAMLVILLFLHNLRGTLMVSLAIPACIVATFLVLNIAAFTLNQITLLALSLSVGILVDDSIVVLESITRHLKSGENPRDAALNGRAEIGFADVTTTLVDVVVFVPIAFMGGIVGGFFKEFGLTIATATLLSLVVSFSVTPMLAARWYRKGENLEAKRGLYLTLENLYQCLERGYRRLIAVVLRRRGWVILTGIAALITVSALSLPNLGTEFLPGADQGLIAISIETPPGSSLSATDAVAKQAENALRNAPDVLASETTVGQVIGGFGSLPQQGSQFAQINLFLRDKAGLLDKILHPGLGGRARSDENVADSLKAALAEIAAKNHARITAAAVRSISGLSDGVAFQLRGADINALTKFAEMVRERIKTVPGVVSPDITVRSGAAELRAEIDPQRAAQFHIAVNQAGQVVRDSIAGNADNALRQNGVATDTPIRVQLKPDQRTAPADIAIIPVGSDAQGQSVALADIARLRNATGPTNIDRYNGQRVITVSAALAPGYALGNVEAEVLKIVNALPHPGITLAEAGDSKTLAENVPYFVSALLLAVALVYIVMASLFNSLATPFVIMFTLPMALMGAFAALALTGESLSLVSGIGILMLIGLMTRNAILLLDYTNTLRGRGMARTDALIEAGATRLRPILMTTTATIIGMLPIALRIGEAAEVRAPMAVVVIGGLLVSTVLTLLVIPALYSLFDDWTHKKNRGNIPDSTAIPPTP